MILSEKYRKLFYWATLIVSAASVVLAGLAGMFGIVTVEAAKNGAAVAGTILGIITPVLALFNMKPDNTESK